MDISLYREKKVSIPRPELYVVYTGNKQHVPDELKPSSLFEGDGSVELSVKVLRDDGKGALSTSTSHSARLSTSR